jgi:1-deoxy-D-xylulose-5-phosphate reductoisomerase
VEINIGPQQRATSSLGIPIPFAFPNQNSVGSPMSNSVRNLAILGATGSIGKSTAEVAEVSGGRLKIVGLTANTSLGELCDMAHRIRPRWVAAADRGAASRFDWSRLPAGTELLVGQDGIERLATSDEVDVVVAAIVGSAGLRGTWAALEAGKTVALANKETLVMAGPLVMRLAREREAALLPVDSEHSAVFQALQAGRREQLRRIILTASGGPFLRHSAQQLSQVTVRDALAHPTWEMGPKITIDSATMMNKALEVIEARWLFDVRPDQIEVVVHPQSIVHSLVEFVDGSVLAQLSPPDMKLPIQYALSHPDRWECPAPKLDLTEALALDFEPPDLDRFPALQLGFEVARVGGTAGAVLNAANEAAVAAFLAGELAFLEIVPACRAVLDSHEFDANPGLEQLIQLDDWARQEVTRWVLN